MGIVNHLVGWTKLGIRRGDLVLEVGSGGRPFARSDVLCDMFVEDSIERQEGELRYPILADRPFVCANAERLPFRDGAFDFLLSAHLLEHLVYPEQFLEEAQRVSRRGYLVTPSAFCEKVLPRETHLWMVSTDQDGTLLLEQKRRANEIGVPPLLHQAWQHDRRFRRFFGSRPDLFETRFHWEGSLSYRVIRYEKRPSWLLKGQLALDANLDQTSSGEHWSSQDGMHQYPSEVEIALRTAVSWVIRRAHSRSVPLDLYPLLACPLCNVPLVHQSDQGRLYCGRCRCDYPIRPDGVPVLLSEAATPRDGVAR